MLPWFGLFPVRSPLLGKSRLISLPPGTEMFQFPGLAPFRVTDLAVRRVSPFGHPGLTAHVQLPQAYRSLSRPSSPLDAKASTVCLIAFDLNSFHWCGFLTPDHTFILQLSKSSEASAERSAGDTRELSRAKTAGAYLLLQKGGDPAAGSPTATLLRLRPSHWIDL